VRKSLVLSLLCLFAIVSIAAVGEDLQKGVIHINGGSQVVYVGPHQKVTPHKRPPGTIYSNFNSSSSDLYNCCSGYAVSDGTTIGVEFTEGSSFVSPKTAVVHSITSALSLAGGTGENYVEFRKDCKGVPCGASTGDWQKGDGCHVLVQVSEPFGQCCSTVTAKCKSQVRKGKTYWVVMESKTTDNTETVWNDSNASNDIGPDVYNRDDSGWTSRGSGSIQSAFSVQ
jgi:hypothetical protein